MPQARGGHFLSAQDKLSVPEEMLTTIIEHPIFDAFEGLAPGQHAFVVGEPHRPEAHAETDLAIPEARAHNCIYPKAPAFSRFTQAANAVRRQVQPAASEGLHLGRDLEIFAENRLQSFGV